MTARKLPPSSVANPLHSPTVKRRKRIKPADVGIVPRHGVLDASEKMIIDAVVRDTPVELVPAHIDALALTLRRDTPSVVKEINNAKQRLQNNAERYAVLHLEAAELANKAGQHDVARKASEWALEKISAVDDEGKTHKIIEQNVGSDSNAPVIKIGIALGGLPTKHE